MLTSGANPPNLLVITGSVLAQKLRKGDIRHRVLR